MEIRYFSNSFLDDLNRESLLSERKRKNFNLHRDYSDPCQRFFNAIGLDSYIRPHRHLSDSKCECLIAVSGILGIFLFDDAGQILGITKFGSEKFRKTENFAAGVEIPPNIWHTVVALSETAILFEVKAGPFDPLTAKEFAAWAPEEGALNSLNYLEHLKSLI